MRQFKPAGAIPRSTEATHNPYVCFRCEQACRVPKPMGKHVYCKKCVKAIRLQVAEMAK